VLFTIAIANSDYWKQSLGGLSVCVLDDKEKVVCRVSPPTDGRVATCDSDALIQITDNKPCAYGRLLRKPMSDVHQVDPFCSAAVQAALSVVPLLSNHTKESHPTVIANHEEALHKSMVVWILGNSDYLAKATNQILHDKPTAT
jgi:hypothetical protein